MLAIVLWAKAVRYCGALSSCQDVPHFTTDHDYYRKQRSLQRLFYGERFHVKSIHLVDNLAYTADTPEAAVVILSLPSETTDFAAVNPEGFLDELEQTRI